MLVSFFESFKYIGHFVPIAVLRIFLGYFYFSSALEHYSGSFLTHPILADMINEWMGRSSAPQWYVYYMESFVVPNWAFFSYFITYIEFLIGISLLLGFLVRPIALVGVLLSLNFLWFSSPLLSHYYILQMFLFFILGWLGAGRCLGLDYFFFKRRRGIWW